MKAMNLLKKEDITGAWENEIYSLVIMPNLVFLEEKKHRIQICKEPILMKYMDDRNDKRTFNTMMLSENVQIFQIINDDEISIKIGKENDSYILKRLSFKEEFNFYRNMEFPSTYVAIRWFNPWEYVAIAEIKDCNVVKVMTGNIEEQRIRINEIHSDLLMSPKWLEVNFESVVPGYKQNEIINDITKQIIANGYNS